MHNRTGAAPPPGAAVSERVGPIEAAELALCALSGGPAAAIVLSVDDGARLVLLEDGTRRGTLGDPALDQRAQELAGAALAGAAPSVHDARIGEATTRLYVEAHRAAETLVIAGAGHIAVPLAHIGALLGFRVVVLDDREEFATSERFPEAAEVRRVDFADAFGGIRIGPRSYLVLVTRGHRHDFDFLEQILRRDEAPAYLGMIGSRRRVKAALGALLRGGVRRERLLGIHAPVGLDIGAETPEEIAVSIAGELVAVRRGAAPGGSLRERERVLDRLLPDEESREEGESNDG